MYNWPAITDVKITINVNILLIFSPLYNIYGIFTDQLKKC